MSASTSEEKQTAGSESTATRMTGGQMTVEMLKRNGVDTIFGLPGVQLDGLFSALYDSTSDIRVIHTRHEQATAYMADGYARVTGREGICLVVPGPGLMNAAAALATAYSCNSPVFCLTGQIRSDMIGVGRGLLHEVPDQLEMTRSFTKSAQRVMTPGEIPAAVNAAFDALRSGRPRPVEMEVPPDIFFAEDEVMLPAGAAPRDRYAGDDEFLKAAAKALVQSKRPVLYGGGGLLRADAGDALLRLAELLQAPIVLTRNGKGAVSDREDLVVGPMADNIVRESADVIVGVGTRFININEQPRPIDSHQTLIRIDIDPEEIERNQPADIKILADAGAALQRLIDLIEPEIDKRASRHEEFRTLAAEQNARVNAIQPQADFGAALRNAIPDDGIMVSEMTQLGYWGNLGYPAYRPNTYITPGYQGTLGYGFTTAMGAKVGQPGKAVVSVNGDGGFGFTLNELSTVVQHGINLVTVVFNDSAYGNVRRIQNEDLGGKTIASDLLNPDYQKLAEAFGMLGQQVETPAALQGAVAAAIERDEPVLIEVPVGVMPNPWRTLGLR